MSYKTCPDCGCRIYEYGCVNCNEEDYIAMQQDDDRDQDESPEEYMERVKEEEAEENALKAATCKCGAWQFKEDGSVHHVADCCCGAE